jgi:hypothetical protein
MTKPSDDTQFNWDPRIFFDPTNLNDIFATQGIPIPTYGNYGGPGYTAGTIGGTVTGTVPPDPPPVDPLDALFYAHDFAVQEANGNLQLIVQASVALVIQMDTTLQNLIDPNSANYDPAVQLYEGLATLAVIGQLIAPGWPSIDSGTQGQIVLAAQHAVVNFEEGLAAIPGEAGSLHGALQVFEHKFADMLPFDLL